MAARRPNFIYILADDLGYADVGCYGARILATPSLDHLAADGVRFTDGYSNSPVCSPTRFALMTGRYQYRLRAGAEEPITGKLRTNPLMGLPPSHPSLPSLLAGTGYATALIGKWHLGWPPNFGPLLSGYEEFFGPLGGGVDYFQHVDRAGLHDLYEGGAQVRREGYLTDLLSDRAVEFVDRAARSKRPFLLSLHYTAPHWPWETRDDAEASKRIAGSISHTDGGSVSAYYRMIEHMDEGIGRLMQALARNGSAEDTLVVFTSDNGGERFSDTWPFVGQKMDLLEGGIRVPLIARWPAGAARGAVCRQPTMTMDWTATVLDAAGVTADASYPLDGISMRPWLREPSRIAERDLYWRMGHRRQFAVRSGRWKYLRIEDYEYLFDLETDGRERANRLAQEPGRVADLRARLARWLTEMPVVPTDARSEVVYGECDIPRPTH